MEERFLDITARICGSASARRRKAIIGCLKDRGIEYSILSDGTGRCMDIVVSFQPQIPERTVILAHYDCVPGSPGANDNGCACSILIGLCDYLSREKQAGGSISFLPTGRSPALTAAGFTSAEPDAKTSSVP